MRPSGELWIVKNRMDPRVRHGYESYSFHSQYNLLTAAMLALAWLRADEGIPEGPCPVDAIGFGFEIQPAFHKAFVGAAGTLVEIDTGADLHYNPTGIVRIHHPGVPPETFSDGVTAACDYTVPARPTRRFTLGPSWQDGAGAGTRWPSTDATTCEPTAFRVVSALAGTCRSRADLPRTPARGSDRRCASVVVARDGVRVEHTVTGDVRRRPADLPDAPHRRRWSRA